MKGSKKSRNILSHSEPTKSTSDGKKTTSKHLKKLNKTKMKKKSSCPLCSDYTHKQTTQAESYSPSPPINICAKCKSKNEMKKRNYEIVQSVYENMGISPSAFIKVHVPSSHETKERRKNKGHFREQVLKRDQCRCHYCHQFGDTIDHVVPISRGGFTTLENCVCSCAFCNHFKADIDVLSFNNAISRIGLEKWLFLREEWMNNQSIIVPRKIKK